MKILADLICKGKNYDEIKNYIISKKFDEKKNENVIEELKENNDRTKLYYLLSIMPSGLPNSLIKLIYPDLDFIMNQKNNLINFIFIDPDDNWNHLNDYKKEIHNFFMNKNNERQDCILNCIKIYSKLLFIYIQNNKQKILYPDINIHYIFNSYNDTGIWKTFDLPMYHYCFSNINNKKEYDKILSDNFDLDRHMKNIISLIINNLDDISSLIKNNDINKEYIEQILINLPTAYFLKKECQTIIEKCIYLSEKLNLENSKNRLLLYLYSLENNQEILNKINNNNSELEIEKEFLKALIEKKILLFDNIIDKNKKLTSVSNIEMFNINYEKKLKTIYAYYENGGLYYFDYVKTKNISFLDSAKNCLIEAKKIAKEINNYFLTDRINIDLFLIVIKVILLKFKDKNNNNENNAEEYFKSVNLLDEVLFQKSYNQKLQSYLKKDANHLIIAFYERLYPDIVILNSNPLKNIYNALNSGIFAYLNNHYYLLEKINEKIKMNIKIESYVLNENNLKEAFNKQGEILIIQSDDYTGNGEIVLESEKGESQILSNETLENMLKEKNLEYKIVILCFINSEKIKKFFEDKVQYLITFDNIDCNKLSNELDVNNFLFQYNKLSIDFLINFIEKTTELSDIEESFNKSKQLFINGLKDYQIETKYINITNKSKLKTLIQYKNNKNGKIILNNVFLNFPRNVPRCKDYIIRPKLFLTIM